MFSYEFCEISKNTFSYRTPLVAASLRKDSPSYILDLGQSKPVKSKLCITTCKNDSGLSNILDPAQSKAVKRKLSDPAKNSRKPIFYCQNILKIFYCQNILKGKPKVYKDFCVACDICDVWFHYKCVGIPRENEMMILGFAVLVKS